MFNTDIEKKIINFIKKSPIGVTSSEIARYLNINRITLAKYLSVIKERALIDFKQLGMAKLWYIPVNINDKDFLKMIITDLVANIDENISKEAIKKSALKIAQQINDLYKQFYNVEKLNLEQICEAITDAEKKIGAEFKVIDKNSKRIILKNTKCPFGLKVRKCPALCTVTSNILGTFAAKNFGYSRVELKKTIARNSDHCYIIIYLKTRKEQSSFVSQKPKVLRSKASDTPEGVSVKTKQSEEEKTNEYYPTN